MPELHGPHEYVFVREVLEVLNGLNLVVPRTARRVVVFETKVYGASLLDSLGQQLFVDQVYRVHLRAASFQPVVSIRDSEIQVYQTIATSPAECHGTHSPIICLPYP